MLQQGVGIVIRTPQGAGNGTLPPQPTPKSLQPQGPALAAARNLPNSPRRCSLHPQTWVSPFPHALHPGVGAYPANQRTPAGPHCLLTAGTLAPMGAWVSARTSCAQVGACCGQALRAATHLFHPACCPGQPCWGTGSHNPRPTREPITRLQCSHPGFPPGMSPGAWLLSGPTTAGSARGNPLPWHSFGAGTPSAGVPRHAPGTHTRGTGCTDLGLSSPLLSSPRRPGRALLPSLPPAALPVPRASQPGTTQEAAGPPAHGALRMHRAPSSPWRGRRGCPCPCGSRQGKGGDARLCPGELAGNWRNLEEKESPGCRAASSPHTEHFPSLPSLLA